MLGESLTFPKEGDEWIKTVLIGGVLSILGSFLFVPLLPVQGYFVRTLRSGVRHEREPPVFDEWGDLFVDGVKILVVQLVYVLVPSFVLFVGLAVAGFGAFSQFGGTGTGATIELVGWGILAIGSLLLLVAVYLVPAAIANLAYQSTLVSAFDVGTLTDAAFTGEYLVAVVLAFVVGLVLGGIAALLSLLIVGVFLAFYVQVSIYYLLGRGFAEGLGLEY